MRRLVESVGPEKGYRVWSCSRCRWKLKVDDGPIEGATLNEMKANFIARRDAAFALHRCEEHR